MAKKAKDPVQVAEVSFSAETIMETQVKEIPFSVESPIESQIEEAFLTQNVVSLFSREEAEEQIDSEEQILPLNIITLVGRVGINPEIKYFESGSVLCKLTLAVKRPTRNRDETDWFNIELWGQPAEVAINYVRKGRLIGVKGYLKIETWLDRQSGSLRSKPVIKVDNIELLDSKPIELDEE